MGGFAKLKQFSEELKHDNKCEDNGLPAPSVIQFWCDCLFEIAGNLDTIAVEMRKQTQIAAAKLSADQVEVLQSVQRTLKTRGE